MKTKLFLILAVLSQAFSSCNGQSAKSIETIPPAVFAEKIKANPHAQLLDVRTPEEFTDDHIDNAVNVNWNGDHFETQASKFDKSKPVFVYCKVGGRSKQAAEKLSEMGFSEVYDLQGGIMKWNAARLSTPSEKIVGMSSQKYGNLLKSDKKVLVNFYADWCTPCKKMKPYMLKMQNELKEEVSIIRLNADEHKTIISELKIDELPVLLLYENNKIIWRHNGFISEDNLRKEL